MIFKSYEIHKINQKINHLILFYGKNEGLKNEALDILIKPSNNKIKITEKKIMDKMNDKFEENVYERSIKQNFAFSIAEKLSSRLMID